MASPVLPFLTCRIYPIPINFNAKDVSNLFPSNYRDEIQSISLAPAALSHFDNTQVAIVTFFLSGEEAKVLEQARQDISKRLVQVALRIPTSFAPVALDMEFDGITVLNGVESDNCVE